MISDRIIVNPLPDNTMRIPKRRMFFYKGYAFFVRRALRNPLFQQFLHWLVKRENIDKSLIKNIRIRVFPHQKENGNSLAGRRKKDGNISIFPRSIEYYRELATKHGNDVARSYVKTRALATLIHEILHTKYSSDEERVRKLTEKYLSIYIKSPKTEELDSIIFDKLFKH